MGQTLSEPVKEKHSASGHDERLLYASSAMQGWRISMEDAHTTLLQINDKKGYSFFGVYDGHGGQNIARYSGAHLHDRIVKDSNFGKNKDMEKAIKNGFLGIDEDLRNDSQYQNDPSGCTAVTAIITDNSIYVGNAGDSRAVLSEDGVYKDMSDDHKPLNKDESSRITKAGGFIEFGRVNGNLALSRAIGDFEFKQNTTLEAEAQIVTALPDVKKVDIKPETEFLVLACDGIWDCLRSQQVVSFIRKNIQEHKSLQKACEDLMDRCLAKDSELGGIGCDNMTVIIVAFLNGRTVPEWYEWMASRYGVEGPKYDAEDVKPQKQEEYQDMNDELEEDMEIPSGDDYDIENQNQLTIDEVSRHNEREDSNDIPSELSNTPRPPSQHSSDVKSFESRNVYEGKGKTSLMDKVVRWSQSIGPRNQNRNNEDPFSNGNKKPRKNNACGVEPKKA